MPKSDTFDWYKRYPKKMIRGCCGLGAAAIGCYNVVLDLIYEDEDSCPDDAAFIGGILGESPRQTRALIDKLVAAGKLAQEGGRLRNQKAKEVLEIRARSHQAAKKNGGLGGLSRVAKASASNKNNALGQATLKHLEENKNGEEESPVSPRGETGREGATLLLFPEEPKPSKPLTKADQARMELYRRGKEILGKSAGGVITNLLKVYDGKVHKALAKLEDAAEMREPERWLNAFMWKTEEAWGKNIEVGPM